MPIEVQKDFDSPKAPQPGTQTPQRFAGSIP